METQIPSDNNGTNSLVFTGCWLIISRTNGNITNMQDWILIQGKVVKDNWILLVERSGCLSEMFNMYIPSDNNGKKSLVFTGCYLIISKTNGNVTNTPDWILFQWIDGILLQGVWIRRSICTPWVTIMAQIHSFSPECLLFANGHSYGIFAYLRRIWFCNFAF